MIYKSIKEVPIDSYFVIIEEGKVRKHYIYKKVGGNTVYCKSDVQARGIYEWTVSYSAFKEYTLASVSVIRLPATTGH